MTSPTNTELLKNGYPAGLLTGLDGQRRFLLREFIQRRPCPVCAEEFNRMEGEGKELDAYDVAKATSDAESCPHCGCPVIYTLPFVGGWYWRVDRSRATLNFAPVQDGGREMTDEQKSDQYCDSNTRG